MNALGQPITNAELNLTGLFFTGAPSGTGAGLAFSYTSGSGRLSAVDYGGPTWQPINIVGSVVNLSPYLFDAVQADASSAAGDTRLLLYDVDKGALSRVTVGANDSGGTGYKLLRVPN